MESAILRFNISGLDNVYLVNGFQRRPHGNIIVDLDGFNAALVQALCHVKRPLTGKEYKVVKTFLKLSALDIAFLCKKDHIEAHTLVSRSVCPEEIDVMLRSMALRQMGEPHVRTAGVKEIRAWIAENRKRRDMFFQRSDQGWCQVQPVQLVTT